LQHTTLHSFPTRRSSDLTYTPDTITLNMNTPEFIVEGGLWHGRSLYDLYKEAHTPWEWHAELFEYAKNLGITIFSSPFDYTAVEDRKSTRLNSSHVKISY